MQKYKSIWQSTKRSDFLYKKGLFSVALLTLFAILVACDNPSVTIKKIAATPKLVEKEIHRIGKEHIEGGIFLLQTEKKSYVYIRDDRRDRSMLANNVKNVSVVSKGKEITLKVRTERVHVGEAKNRDVLYVFNGKKVKHSNVFVQLNGQKVNIKEIIIK